MASWLRESLLEGGRNGEEIIDEDWNPPTEQDPICDGKRTIIIVGEKPYKQTV